MTIKSLLAKLGELLREDRRVQMQKHESLKKILKALKNEKSALEESLAEADDHEARHEIEARLKIVSAQRKKGLELLKSLRKWPKNKRAGE